MLLPTHLKMLPWIAALLAGVSVDIATAATTAPLPEFFPIMTSVAWDSADDNPASLGLVPENDENVHWNFRDRVRFGIGYFHNRYDQNTRLRANSTFLARRFQVEPERFHIPAKDTRFFPFVLGYDGTDEKWFWSGEVRLFRSVAFNLSESYYFDNPVAATMDYIRLRLDHDLHFFRFRGTVGLRLDDDTMVAVAPIIHIGFYNLLSQKEYYYAGPPGDFESYRIDLEASLRGPAFGMQVGIRRRFDDVMMSAEFVYGGQARLQGDVSLDGASADRTLVMTLPDSVTIMAEVSTGAFTLQGYSRISFWTAEMYASVPVELDIPRPNHHWGVTVGVGGYHALPDGFQAGAGYLYHLLPEDSRAWKYVELQSRVHQFSGRLAHRTDHFELTAGVSILVDEDGGDLPAAFSTSMGITYLL